MFPELTNEDSYFVLVLGEFIWGISTQVIITLHTTIEYAILTTLIPAQLI